MAAILQLRRGTTPSTTISEPYFNTSLNTLQIGTGGSTITLVKIGSNIGNVSFSGTLGVSGITSLTEVTGSSLYITGDTKIDGNLRLGGNIFLGSGSDGDLINVNASLSGSLIPETDGVFDLGASSYKYRNLYVLSASIDNISLPGSGILSSSNENFGDFSQSVDDRLDSIQSFTSSQETINGFYNSFTSSVSGRLDNLELTSESHDSRLNNLEGVSGSYATTGSNIFIGNQTISGSIFMSGSRFEAKVPWPEQDSEYNLFQPEVFTIEELSSGSRTYGYNGIGLEHYNDDFYDSYHNSLNFYFFSSSNFLDSTNYGSEFNVGPLHSFMRMYPSGSNITISQNMGNISLNDLQDGRTRANIYGNEVHLGAFRGDTILIGNTGSLNIVKGTTFHSGNLDLSGSITSDEYRLETSLTETIPALNSTFNLDLVPSGSTTTFINKSLVLGDGKILVAGRFQSIDGHTTNDIARLNSDGTIDTSFVAPMFSGSNFVGGDTAGWINTFVTQSDGKIVVGGNFVRVGEGGDARRGIARLNANGTLDTSFVTQSFNSFNTTYGVRDIVIQNDDKILFVGHFTSGSRRVNTDGTLDTTFDVAAAGISQFNNQPLAFNNGEFYSVALLDSGSEQAILIGGEFQGWGSFSSYNHLVKLNPNGALDFGFAGTNLDIATGDSLDRIQKIKVTDAYSAGDNGYIYIAGRFKDTRIGAQGRHAGFARLETEDNGVDGRGAFDSGFRLYISGSDQNNPGAQYVNDFDFYDGDKILLGGSFTSLGNPLASYQTTNRFIIVNNNNGSLIDGFSSSTYNLNTGSVNSVTLLPNDNVLVGGTFTQANSTAREGLASFKLTGLGEVTTTIDYSITADTTQLLVSSSNTYFSGDVNISGSVTASVFSGSFVGIFNGTLPSQDNRLDSLEDYTSSQDTKNTFYNTFTASADDRLTQLETNSGSQGSDLVELFSTASNHEDRIDNLENYTSSLKQAIDVTGQDLTIYGNLVVQGETTTLNTTELLIEDKILSLASGSTTSAQADGAGLHISGANASILWNDSQTLLEINQKVSSSVGFKGDGSELTGVTAAGIDFNDITNKPSLVSGSDQVTQSLDVRYLEIDGDNVVSGSSQIIITDTTGFSTFSGSLKSTDDAQDSRLSNLELTSQSHDGRIAQLEADSGSQGGRLDNLELFTSSQETINSTYNSYTQSNDTNITELFGTSSQYQFFSESIDSTIKNKIDLEGVVSSSSDTSTISLFINDGVISGDAIGGVISGSDQVTSSLDSRYEGSGSVAQLTGIHQISGSLGSAAWYNVSSSIEDGNPAVLGNAGAVKSYVDAKIIAAGAGDITEVIAGNGLSGGALSGSATLTLHTSSAHFTDGVTETITPFSSSVSASIAALESSSGYINYVTNSIEQLTGIEVADFDNNVAVTFIGGTLKFIFGTPAVPSSIAASLSGFLTDRFNQVNDEYIINGTWSNGGYTLISASLYEDSTLLNQVGSGTSVSFTTTTSGSHTYRLELTGSSPLDGSIFTSSATTTGTLSKTNPVVPTLTPTATVQLGASSNQIEQGATGSISFTSSSADPSNGWNLVDVTTNVGTPYFVTGSATGSSSIVITATADYESPIGDNTPDLTIQRTTTQTYTKIRSLRHGASTSTSFTAGELENISTWDTTLGGDIGTIIKGTTNPSGQSVTISWSGDKFHYIVFDSSRSNLSNITTSGFGVFGDFVLSTVGQYKVYKSTTLKAGGAGSSITYTLT